MLAIEINKQEYNYLYYAPFLNDKYKKSFSFVQLGNGNYLIKISENEADEIRDLCGEQLQLTGFDKNYALTSEGKILESLIDKFFIG